MTAPGWYQAEGDPPGTTRYWDGGQWVGEPVATPAIPTSPVGAGPGGTQLASAGSRIGARVIDVIFFIIITLIFLWPAFSDMINGLQDLPNNPSDAQVEQVFEDAFDDREGNILIATVAGWLIETGLIAFTGGTIGKLIVGLRVADKDTGVTPPAIGKAFLRTLNHGAGVLLGLVASQSANTAISGILLLVGLVSLIMLFTDDRRRTVMDHIAGTVVVRK